MAKKSHPEPAEQRRRRAWREHARRAARRLADSPLPVVVFISTFILIRWWNNSDFSYPSEVWVPASLFGVLASIIFIIYRFILGPGIATLVASLLAVYGLYVYQFVGESSAAEIALKLIPDSWQTEFTVSIYLGAWLLLVSGAAGWLAGKAAARSQALQALQVYKVILFAIFFIFAFQLVKAGDRLLDIRRQLTYHYPPASISAQQSPTTGPDIYYLVFDRFASASVLQNNFEYDNSALTDYLKESGFTVRDPAYSNYPFTQSSVASTLAMDFFPEFEEKFGDDGRWQGAFPYRDILNNPPIADTLRSHGYTYTHVSSWWDFTRVGIAADNHPTRAFVLEVPGKDWYLTDLQRDIVNKSVLAPWLKKGISAGSSDLLKYDLTLNPRQNFEAQMKALKAVPERSDKSAPVFTFAHVLAPHPPYEFAPDGSDPNYDAEANDNGVDEKVKYTNSVAFVSDQLKQLVGHIRAKSPNAVIVIQADEGPYPKQFRGALSAGRYYDPIDLSLPDMQQKLGIMAAYFMPGVEQAKVAELDASVNVFPFILNNYLGYELPYLPDCHFSTGNKFTLYKYELLPAELKGQPIPADCQKYD